MATTTPNFGWTVPTSTDLVKDGATAIETLGDGIDASFVGLKGGTTGQVLSKTSGTDLAFTWVAQDDSNAIQNAIVDAKGDLIAATAADTPARLAVGTNGQVLTADSTAATGLAWATATSGGMTLISTTSMAGVASVTLSSISGSYKSLRILIKDYYPATAGQLKWELNSDTTAANYGWALNAFRPGTSQGLDASASDNKITALNVQNSSGENFFEFVLPDYANSTTYKIASTNQNYLSDYSTARTWSFGSTLWTNTAAITSIKFLHTAAGNFTAGSIELYGVN